jgi:hypothetical protein
LHRLGRAYGWLRARLAPRWGKAWPQYAGEAMGGELGRRFYCEGAISAALDPAAHPAVARLRQALDAALGAPAAGSPPEAVLGMEGMSGRKYRRLINALVAATPDARYMEVGSWAGSTACAALWNNPAQALCIDNWSLFQGPKDRFLRNVQSVLHPAARFRHLESDFRAVDYGAIGRFNLYLFDGPHEEQDQYDGVRLALPALDPVFTLVVDDWNWGPVRRGTERALADAGVTVLGKVEIRSSLDDRQPFWHGADSDWHDGYLLAVCRQA